MLKQRIAASLLWLAFTLTGCSMASVRANGQTSDGGLNTAYENAISVEFQLALGTLKLEGTDYAISSQTAAELLPLWKAVRSLSANDSTAQAELDAAFTQIQESMSPEQIEAIAAMQLTKADISTVLGGSGMGAGAASGQAGSTRAAQSSSLPANPVGGEAPPAEFGGPNMDGAAPMDTGGSSAALQSTLSANTSSASESGLPPLLLDAIIQSLQAEV